RHGEVLHELRVDYSVQRLPWTPLTALRHQLLGLDGHNVRDAAALVVDNRTGAVLAYIGSAGPASRTRFKDMSDNWCLGYTSNYTERPPRIDSPADGPIIALDPDIPAHHQALLFAAQGDRATLNWTLDGKLLGQADTLLWPPVP